MARHAVVAEIACSMIRIYGLLKIRLMTLETILIHELIVTVRMTGLALLRCMRSRQLEVCSGMIERCGFPRIGGMALKTIVR
jgi:hypothetical protein